MSNLTKFEHNICLAIEGANVDASQRAVSQAQEMFLRSYQKDRLRAERAAYWWCENADGLKKLFEFAAENLKKDFFDFKSTEDVSLDLIDFVYARVKNNQQIF